MNARPFGARASVFVVAVALLVPVASACSSGSSAPTTSAAHGPVGVVVTLKFVAFAPQNVTVRVGQAVEWKWEDAPVPHNVTFANFHSPTQATGTFFHTFTQPGTYPYRCTIHSDMTGTVVVLA
jgi:plastocyanin